ncbi:MAG: DUF5597 domain-containing protein [Chitinophagaceae bacterium]|nr:DUF5597 domain-containing protein [Chitinophagaceae bacterium]
MNRKERFLFFLLLIGSSVAFSQTDVSGVQLKKVRDFSQLIINGKPFIVLGGELGNSIASNMEYLKPFFPKIKSMNLNTVLAPVYWEFLEPEENKFDFSLVDGMITEARKNDMKLVLLWFGSWKNSMSCYAPSWMKTNSKRFPRTVDSNGRSHEIFSVFGKETLEADKKAFAALMKHIRETDVQQKTVIMVQVENEIGMLTTAREISKTANSYFNENVPPELMTYLQKNKDMLLPELKQKWQQYGSKQNGTWATVFGEGDGADEIFQAWYYAKYANEVAAAGKKEYNLPMFVNAALPRPGKRPGEYPSAGPLPHIMDIWQAAATSLDMLSPDFYNPDTKYWCDLYTTNGNPLFVPEMKLDESCAAKAFFIIGHYKALGFSPFSIENADGKVKEALGKSYDIINQVSEILFNRKWLSYDGLLVDKKDGAQQLQMGNYMLKVSHEYTMGWSAGAKDSVWPSSGVMIIQLTEKEFIVAGTGVVITFENKDQNKVTNLLAVDEIEIKAGKENFLLRLNGDEDHQGRHVRIATGNWQIQKVRLYDSPAKVDQ